jgi:hypothetical protein
VIGEEVEIQVTFVFFRKLKFVDVVVEFLLRPSLSISLVLGKGKVSTDIRITGQPWIGFTFLNRDRYS